jgi:hypothetical protein
MRQPAIENSGERFSTNFSVRRQSLKQLFHHATSFIYEWLVPARSIFSESK